MVKPYKFLLTFFLVIICHFSNVAQSQNHKLYAGARFQKSVALYTENGINLQYSNQKFSRRMNLGFSYLSTRLGSAIGSNAIKQDNFLLSGSYLFRPDKKTQPFTSLNVGWFSADFESEIFNNVPNTSPLLSL
jgi:hypothetical protein